MLARPRKMLARARKMLARARRILERARQMLGRPRTNFSTCSTHCGRYGAPYTQQQQNRHLSKQIE